MTTPALQRLRERFPAAHITLLTHEKLEGLWRRHPSVDAVMTFEKGEGVAKVAARIRTASPAQLPENNNVQAAPSPRTGARPFELALVLPNSPRSALEVWLARIPQRVGFAAPWRNWLLTNPVLARAGRLRPHKRSTREVQDLVRARTEPALLPVAAHQIHEYLHLAGALNAEIRPLAPRLVVTEAESQEAQKTFLAEWLNQAGEAAPIQPPLLLGLNPGGEYGPAKRWPVQNLGSVAREISRRHRNCRWLIFGGQNDQKLAGDLARLAGPSALNLAGRTSLRELMALLRLCRVLLTNDTGPMHVAAALGTPVVVPFGSTSPELTGPGLPGDPAHRLLRSQAPCAPCFRRTCPIDFRCMTGISVTQVVDAVLEAAARNRPSQGQNPGIGPGV
jgi:heptosyltransferase-2